LRTQTPDNIFEIILTDSMSQALIEYHNVTVRRGERVALDDVTLSIHEGEHVAILGPNGSGKSSLIKTITRECYPVRSSDNGGIRILGRDSWNVFELRGLLGIVSNDLMQACTRDHTALEIVLSGFFSSVGIWPHHQVTDAMEKRAEHVLRLLEIPHLSERGMNDMSSGEARRVLIGRSLVHDPKALILDEPSTSLDFRAGHELREILRKIALGGTNIVLATHDLHDIIPEIARVILIKNGRVARDGPKAEILTSVELSRLFETDLEVVEQGGFYQMW
jgi:iron complex transport system ATP-binding protein